MTYLVLFLVLMLIAAAGSILFLQSPIQGVIVMSVVSLMASILFLLMAAPDVAITEASVGSALTTIVFVIAIRKSSGGIRSGREDGNA